MSNKEAIQTDQAPAPIGPYSQAVKVGETIYLSGQIPIDPATARAALGDSCVQNPGLTILFFEEFL